MNAEDLFSFYQNRSSNLDIITMLMALSASVMKADGKVLRSELNYVKSFFKPNLVAAFMQIIFRFLSDF